MKILFASHLYPNPAEPLVGTFVAELARAMAAQAAVSVVAPVTWMPGMRARKGIPTKRREGAVEVFHPRRLACPGPLRNLRWRAHLAALRAAGLTGPWAVIHSHWIDPDAYAVSHWEGSQGALLVATIHGHAGLGLGLHGRPSPLIRKALHRTHHLVAVSSELKIILVGDFGVAAERVSVLSNGMDPARFRLEDRAAARQRLGLPVNRRLVLNVARLSPEKRHDLLIEAVARCPERDFDVRLVGGGALESGLRASIQSAGLQDRIFLQGGIAHDQLPDWYAAADLFCLSSAHEGCPVVILEALACGVPIVSTRVGAVPDLVEAEAGFLSEPGDAMALSQALALGLRRSWDRERIARRGGARTWDAVACQLLGLYQRLAPVGAPSGPA